MVQARNYLDQLFHPVFLRAFDCLQPVAFKLDLFRMALLYREGGWHSDWKQVCLENGLFENLSNATSDFFATACPGDCSVPYELFGVNRTSCVSNAIVGMRPRHPIVAKFLELILLNVKMSLSTSNNLLPTGPCLLGLAVHYVNQEEHKYGKRITEVAGEYSGSNIYLLNGRNIAMHKCENCGHDQNWGDAGNDYAELYYSGKAYCQDAASLFVYTKD